MKLSYLTRENAEKHLHTLFNAELSKLSFKNLVNIILMLLEASTRSFENLAVREWC